MAHAQGGSATEALTNPRNRPGILTDEVTAVIFDVHGGDVLPP